MTEQKIEKLFVDRFTALAEQNELNIQIVGTLQQSMFEKAEESNAEGILIVKISPREYESPMTPTCKMNGAISLSLRADVDYNGHTYLEVCDIILSELQKLQQCIDDVHERYTVDGEWVPTGFIIGSGDTSIDTANKMWAYTHSFTMYGILG